MRKEITSKIITVEFPSINFINFTPFTTLGDVMFNFSKAKKLKRIYPLIWPSVSNVHGVVILLDVNGNQLQTSPSNSITGISQPPTLKVDSRLVATEFLGIYIGGVTVDYLVCDNTFTVGVTMTFEFEDEFLVSDFE